MRAITGAIVLAVTLTLAGATPSSAQGFDVGQVDVGGVVGLGGINGAGFAVGGRVEKGVKVLPDLGGGILGIEGAFDWYHYNYSLLGVDFGSITGNWIRSSVSGSGTHASAGAAAPTTARAPATAGSTSSAERVCVTTGRRRWRSTWTPGPARRRWTSACLSSSDTKAAAAAAQGVGPRRLGPAPCVRRHDVARLRVSHC